MKYNRKGGSSNGRQPKVVDNQVYGFEEGSNPRQAALNYQKNMNADQNNLNHVGGKGGLPKKTKNNSRKSKSKDKKQNGKYSTRSVRIKLEQAKKNNTQKSGGSGSGRSTTVEVPQFSTPGPKVSPLDANSASVKGNESALQAQANAVGDCYATNSCGTKGGTRRRGGRRIGGTRRGGRRRGGRRRGGTRRGGRRRGGTTLVRNKWGCMSGGNAKCQAEINDLKQEAKELLKKLEEINEQLKDIIPNPESSGKSDKLPVEIEKKIKNIMKQSGGNGEEDKCSDEQNEELLKYKKAIKDLNIAIETAEDLISIN